MSAASTKKRKLGGREATEAIIPGDYALSVGDPGTPLPKDWQWRLLTDMARLESGHTPSRRKPDYWGGDIPWIGIRDATGNHGRTIFKTNENTNDLGISNSAARVLPAGTVCLSRTASVGYVVTMGRDMATSQDFVNWTCGAELDNRFLKYALIAEGEALLRFASGSVHQTIYFPEVKSFHLATPPLAEQELIGEALSAFDDKIDLNRRMNETLEAMAQAIFRDWFVDFGPTRRKMEGATDPVAILGGLIADPEKAAPLAALFPSTLGEDGLPGGWEERSVNDDFDVVMGQSPPGSTYNEEGDGLPFFQGRRDFKFRFPEKRVYCNAPTRLAEEDWTLVSVRAPVGDINRAWERCCIGRGVGALMHKQGLSSLTYYAGLHLRDELATYDKDGTVFGSINQKQLKGLKLNATNSDAAAAFDELVVPIDDLIRSRTAENQTLAATRDLLLPKLMSGEIRVREAEAVD